MLAWVDAVVPGANVTMYPAGLDGCGRRVRGSGRGRLGGGSRGGLSGRRRRVGAAVGSAVGVPTARRSASGVGSADGSGLDEASADGAGLCDGSAARTGMGANRAITSRATCVTTRNRIARSRACVRLRTEAPRSSVPAGDRPRPRADRNMPPRTRGSANVQRVTWGGRSVEERKMTGMSAVAPDRAPESAWILGGHYSDFGRGCAPDRSLCGNGNSTTAARQMQYRHAFAISIWGAVAHRITH